MNTRLMHSVAFGALAFGLAASPVAAQDAEEDTTIIVTAQKREQNILDVPISIDVLSGEELAAQQISSMEDIALLSPSVTFSQSTNALNSSVNIRGIGTSVFSSAVEPSVSFVIDGVVMARQGQSFTDLIDIERVEILRGPQSTLFGKNASAGVVSVTTKAPSSTFEADGQILVAEGSEYQLSGTVSGPINDIAKVRLTGFYKDVGGHIENIFNGEMLNGHKSWGLRGKLLLEPTDRLSFEVIGDYRKSNDKCCQWQQRITDDPRLASAILPLVASPENDQVNVDGDVFNKTSSWGAQLNTKYDFGAVELTSITASRRWDFSNSIDIDGTPSDDPTAPLYFFGGLLGLDVNDNDQTLKQFSQELRLASTGGGPLHYVVGAFYSTLDYGGNFKRRLCFLNVSGDDCPASFFGGRVPGARSYIFYSDVESSNLAFFGQLDYDATDRLTLTGGMRVLRDHTRFSYNRPYISLVPGDLIEGWPAPEGETDGPDNPLRSGAGSVTDWAMTGKVAASYKVADTINVYASYTRGYKGPTVDLPSTGLLSEIKPETSNAFEAGIKGSGANGRVMFSLTAFHVDYNNYQGQTFDAAEGIFRLSNAGKIRTQGFEGEITVRPVKHLMLSTGVAYTKAKIVEFGNGPCYTPFVTDADCDLTTLSKDYAGMDINNSPDLAFVFNSRYDLVLPDSVPFDMFVTANYQWQDDNQFSLAGNPNTIQPAYGIANMSIGATDKDRKITATLFVKNLFDKHFSGILFEDILGALSPVGANYVDIDQYNTKNANRYFGGSLRFSF